MHIIDKNVTAAGILPYAVKDNKLYLLCGINHKGEYTDLGGKRDEGESIIECAAREFYEESVGLVMSYKKLLQIEIEDTIVIKSDKVKQYVCYITEIECMPKLNEKYQKKLEYIKKHDVKKRNDIKSVNYNINKLEKLKYYPHDFFELNGLEFIELDKLRKSKLSYRLNNLLKHVY